MGKLRNNPKTACLLLGISCLVVASGLAIPSFAWFAKAKTQADGDSISGSSTSAYFRGKGTAESPYLIESQKQLYYFNWLQDLGYFNKKEDGSDSIDQIYFSLENDLDMGDYILPPAGTKEYPFLGNFNGNNHVVKNLKISNDFSSLTKKPANAKDEDGDGLLDDAEIIGFFGIIGEWANGDAYTFDKKVNAVSALYFDNLQISSNASKTLGGLLAGYVNGSMTNCAVRSGNISFASGASPIQDNVFGTTNDKLSKYSLIGDYNAENFSWEGKPGGGQDNDWGGSIDFASLSKRLTYIVNNDPQKGSTSYHEYTNATFNSKLYIQTTGFDWTVSTKNAKTNQTIFLEDGTYLPLNIDLTDVDNYDEEGTTSVYKNDKAEKVKDTNTGYLVGIKSTSSAYPRHSFQISKKDSNGIIDSVATQKSGKDETNLDTLFASSNFCFYSLDQTNKQTLKIKDSENSATSTFDWAEDGSDALDWTNKTAHSRYYAIKDEFITGLKNGAPSKLLNDGTFLLHGLKMAATDISLTSDILTESNLKIQNQVSEGTDYQLYKGGLNFTLNKDGYIRVIVGTYADSKSSHGFFDLYKVQRDASHAIQTSQTTRITQIYKSASGQVSYNSASSDSDELVIDFERMMYKNSDTVLQPNKAYYFELPVTAGDYFLTIYKRDNLISNFPYILYLDIGANANGDGDTGGTPDIDFTYYTSGTTLAKLSDSDYVKSDVVFAITGTPPSTTSFYFWRKNSASVVFYYIDPAGCVITPTGNGSSLNPGSKDDYTSGA